MEILDKDGSGLVSREEWISYLCIGEKTKSVFRGNLKLLFNKYDADNSGALSLREIRSLLTDNMRDLYLKFRVININIIRIKGNKKRRILKG